MSLISINNCNVTYSDFGKICRLCLAANGNLRNIIQQNIILLNRVVDIQISEDDELPKGICNKCAQMINEMIGFIDFCKRNDQILRNILWKRKSIQVTNQSEHCDSHHINDNEVNYEMKKIDNKKTCQYCNISCKDDHSKRHGSECEWKRSGETTINQEKRKYKNDHPNQTLYKCAFCPKQFKFKSKLKQHTHRQQIKLGLLERKYKEKRVHLKLTCQRCEKVFSSRSGFHYHRLKHDGKLSQKAPDNKNKNAQTFLCNYCGKSLNTKSNLDDHIRIHTGENPFKCKDCSKGFRQKSALNRHRLSHLDKRNLFICKICEKEFTTKAHRDIHMRIHTGEKPYECEFCQKQFNYKTQWRIHQRLHTGETPFVCDTCNNAYHDKGSLRKHQKNKSHFVVKSDCSVNTNQNSKKGQVN